MHVLHFFLDCGVDRHVDRVIILFSSELNVRNSERRLLVQKIPRTMISRRFDDFGKILKMAILHHANCMQGGGMGSRLRTVAWNIL